MPDSNDNSFEVLLDGARNGRADSVNELIAYARDFVRRKAGIAFPPLLQRRVDASDAAQDVALEVVQTLSQFNGTTQAEFENWLRMILASRVLRFIRDHIAVQARTVRREHISDDVTMLSQLTSDLTPPHIAAERRECAETLSEIQSTLSEQACLVWIWRAEDKSIREICRKLQLKSVNEVARMLREVRTELKRYGLDRDS
ncbi:MAG: polymerase factor sigma-70 [Planctomycetaceae bacterium]|nr:polymerase factor sigma-70 [Planctomycetaceae bacterium]